MGDSCCSMGSMGSIAKLIQDELGVFVYSIATGEGEYKDVWSSFYGEPASYHLHSKLSDKVLRGFHSHLESFLAGLQK